MAKKLKFKKVDVIDRDEKLLASSEEVSFSDNRITLHGYDFPVIDHDTRVKILGYFEDGIMPVNGKITLSIETQMNLEIIKSDGKHDRRAYLKVQTDMKAAIKRTYSTGSRGKCLLVNDKVEVRDISAGGICFYSDKIYFVRQKLEISLYELRKDLLVKAVILRKHREYYKPGYRYRYGCEFIEVNNVQQRVIFEYVFKIQLADHHKELEKDMKIYD